MSCKVKSGKEKRKMKKKITSYDDIDIEMYLDFAKVIIKTAVEDYSTYCRIPNPDDLQRKEFTACRDFFLSDWFVVLTRGSVDGKALLEKLDKMVKQRSN